MESVELSNAFERHAAKLRKDAATYAEHGNDPLVERTLRLADTFARLGEQVFGNVVRITEEPWLAYPRSYARDAHTSSSPISASPSSVP